MTRHNHNKQTAPRRHGKVSDAEKRQILEDLVMVVFTVHAAGNLPRALAASGNFWGDQWAVTVARRLTPKSMGGEGLLSDDNKAWEELVDHAIDAIGEDLLPEMEAWIEDSLITGSMVNKKHLLQLMGAA